jgi:hydrogenase maturation protease
LTDGPSILIVGVGNAYRRDDGVGPAIASRLRSALAADIRVVAKDGNFVSLLDDWQGTDTVIIADATSSGSAPGTISRHEAHKGPLPAECSQASTHSFGIAETIELARAVGRLPLHLIVYGIEGRDFSLGEGLSPDVAAAVDEVARLVTQWARVRE